MKALLLAAGYGTRLRPLTNDLPKCLVPLGGRPLLDYWWPLLREHGIREVLLNTHCHPLKVAAYVKTIEDPKIRLFHETELLGTAGTLWENRPWFGEETFFVIYADQVSRLNLSRLLEVHHRNTATLTMALFHAPMPNQCGIVSLEGERVTSFVEKPENPLSDLANAGIYCVEANIFEVLAERMSDGSPTPFDFGMHVLPDLASRGKLYGWIGEDYHVDIGTWDAYRQAELDLQRGIVQ